MISTAPGSGSKSLSCSQTPPGIIQKLAVKKIKHGLHLGREGRGSLFCQAIPQKVNGSHTVISAQDVMLWATAYSIPHVTDKMSLGLPGSGSSMSQLDIISVEKP